MKKVNDLIARQREINDKLSDIATIAATRELTDAESSDEKALKREFEANRREIATLNQAAEAARLEVPVRESENDRLRAFIREAKPGKQFVISMRESSPASSGAAGGVTSMSTADTAPYVQGVTVVDLINTERPDADVLTAAGVPMTLGVRGNKIQWAFAGGVEAVFANELAETTERKIDLDKQTPIQQRLTVRVRVSNQALTNSDFDLRSIFVKAVQDSIREKVNWAACSTTKATETFYGGFAQNTESGTYGQSGYTPGKQAGTYSTLGIATFAEMVGKLAARNIKLDNICFVMGAAEFWALKATPRDAGSGLMVIDDNNRILGVPVICCNAINKATQKGAVSGHNVGLGNFAGLPVMQHGDIRLSIDAASAVAANTDEVIITINADFSMTVLKDMADAFVVYAKS